MQSWGYVALTTNFWEYKSFTRAVRTEMNFELRVGLATLSSCIPAPMKDTACPLQTWILLSRWLLSLSILAISQPQEDDNWSLTLQKQMPSSEIRGGCFTLPSCCCVLCRAGCFPSMKMKWEMYFPFCTWQRMLFWCPLGLCSHPQFVAAPVGSQSADSPAEDTHHQLRRRAFTLFWEQLCLLAAHLQGAPGMGVVRLAYNILNKSKECPRNIAYCSNILCVQQQPLTIVELILSLNTLHLWLFRFIFYWLHHTLPLYKVQFPSHFSKVYFWNMFLIPLCFHQSGLRNLPMQYDLEHASSAHAFYSLAQCSLDMIHLWLLLRSDFSRGARGYRAAVKQAQHLPNAAALLAGTHVSDKYLGFFSMKTRALGWGDWGEWGRERRGLGGIIVGLSQGWSTHIDWRAWKPSWLQQHYKTVWDKTIWKCCLWTSLVWEVVTL